VPVAGPEAVLEHEGRDPEVRRRALLLKIAAVPVVHRAAFQPDPLVSLLDLWLLLYQVEECFDAGTGPCLFGAQQPIARAAGRVQREAFEAEIEKVSTNLEALRRWSRSTCSGTSWWRIPSRTPFG
jgi:hypothetical protein